MKIIARFCLILITCCVAACGESFLDIKPDQKQRVPNSVEDYLALMDNTSTMNTSSHALGMIGADDYYLKEAVYNTFPTGITFDFQKNAYTWNALIYTGGESLMDWDIAYLRILWTNLTIENIDRFNSSQSSLALSQNVKGMAHFHRAYNFYNLAQLYSPVFKIETASQEDGIVLRTHSDVNLNEDRSTLAETYTQILSDLKIAENLLPTVQSVSFRPGKRAVYALLSRVYLQMGDYANAAMYCDKIIALNPALIDFNDLVVNTTYTFPASGISNPEVIFMSNLPNFAIMGAAYSNADPELLNSYSSGDLRKAAYFKPSGSAQQLFMGSYTGSNLYFTGFANDEIYLNRAECNARLANTEPALADLNHLRKNRYSRSTYAPLSSTNNSEILKWILSERRKELVMRGTRWEDLRRLNKEPEHAKTLVRQIGSLYFELKPNSVRYVWPIPKEAIERGGYKQNER